MEFRTEDADHMYSNVFSQLMGGAAVIQNSRNGVTHAIPEPVMLELTSPRRRVMFNSSRDANPFFHLMETVWMFAGSNDVRFLEPFNKGYRNYAEPGTDIVHGAYGHRWASPENGDQIDKIIEYLKKDPLSRQLVLQMWDAERDLTDKPLKDRPCNTQCIFRVVSSALDMLVVNRSNDLVWGAMGANVVHFTYLQEAIAGFTNLKLGTYRVVSNNMHIYPGMPRFDIIKAGIREPNLPSVACSVDVTSGLNMSWSVLADECHRVVDSFLYYGNLNHSYQSTWLNNVALPMGRAYLEKDLAKRRKIVREEVVDDAWRLAADRWLDRRYGK